MPAESFGLRRQPFEEFGPRKTTVNTRSLQNGLRFLRDMLDDERGAAWVQGPEGSGKTTLASRFLQQSQDEMAVALVDGEGLYASQLLSCILDQYGYEVSLSSTDELLNMLTVFLVQQTRSRRPPLLIVDNVHLMYPGALNALCKLSSIMAHGRYALRIALFGEDSCQQIMAAPNMAALAERLTGTLAIEPFDPKGSALYLYAKLRGAGAKQPDDIFPTDICDALHQASGGLPGKLDSIAAAVIGQSEELPIRLNRVDHPDLLIDRTDAPRFIVTHAGKTLADVQLVESRVLVGRSAICDILIEDRFVSKQHALIVWNDTSVILIDLSSSNGTYVNSRRVRTRILHNDDIISMGDHRMKLVFPAAGSRTDFVDLDVADTATMQNIASARRRRSVRELPVRQLLPPA